MAGTIREHLHEVVEHGDERLLKILFAVATEYNASIDPDVLTELQRRTEARRSGKDATANWEEAKLMITGKKPL
jgi:hypothetical protein